MGAVGSLKKRSIRPSFHLAGNDVPTVDVLITCCGESLDVILDTVRAACALDYPQERYRVILLDDGNSTNLKGQIEILRKSHGNLFYTARGVGVKTHSKTANLNHGLAFVENLRTGSSEYVAVLDVDMIAMPNLLRALLPHLLNDPSLAMAISPQYFYNIPDGDPLWQGTDLMFDVFLLERDSSDSTFCTGTGFVLRRSAAEHIGRIPTDQINEDIMTSLLLWANNWKSAYVWEPLQWGLVPDTFAVHAKQAARWNVGFTSIVSALSDSRLVNLSLGHRIALVLGTLAAVVPAISITCAMLVFPAILISGKPFLALETPQQLRNLLMLSALQLLATWLNGLLTAVPCGFRVPFWPPYGPVFLSPFQAFAVLRLLFPLTQNFTPTGSTLDGQREREVRDSNSFVRRLKFVLGDPSSWWQLFVIASTVFGMTLHVKAAFGIDTSFQHQIQRLFVSAAWPPTFAHCMMFIAECWKPITYILFPQRILSREALLNRDPNTKVAYPSDMAKDGKRIRCSQGFAIFIMVYTVLVLACSLGMTFE